MIGIIMASVQSHLVSPAGTGGPRAAGFIAFDCWTPAGGMASGERRAESQERRQRLLPPTFEFSSLDAAGMRGCRAGRLPYSNSVGHPARAAPAGVGRLTGLRSWRAGQANAAVARAGWRERGPPRSHARSGWGHALWVSARPPSRRRGERQAESAEPGERSPHRPALA